MKLFTKSWRKLRISQMLGMLLGAALMTGCLGLTSEPLETVDHADTVIIQPATDLTLSPDSIPPYAGEPYIEINGNEPYFSDTDLSTTSCEYYSDLDEMGRCGVAYACIGTDLMPTEERGSIGMVKPSGWHTVKYDAVDGRYLYNRCHLIAYQLSGENDNVANLITGTRYLNIEGMLPFENMVADYVRETENHVMYRVTPIFSGDDPVAGGVQMEAKSVEDAGAGICFHVYCYNVQPGIEIDYATGESTLLHEEASLETAEKLLGEPAQDESESVRVWKSATGEKYHRINDCGTMNPDAAIKLTEEQAIQMGLEKCSRCWQE